MTTTAPGTTQLTTQQQGQFERDGYYFPIRVLEDAQVQDYLACYMSYAGKNKARLEALPPNEKYRVLSETHFVLPWVHEIVMNPRVLDAVEGLLGPNLLAW